MAQEAQAQPVQEQQSYKRFTANQRFEHMVLLVTFFGLALTGLPQRYAAEGWAKALIDLMGGIESIRIVHRIMATVFMAECIYHGGVITYKIFVLGRRANMLPGLRDLRDAWQWVQHNLGLRREHPRMPRYNFGEKAEYLALVWGTIVMVITGFMLWNPITTATVLPGEVIPAARTAHSAEALLAFLSVIIWHLYHVLIKTRNPSIFTGRLSREAMEEEHAEELEKIEAGIEDDGYPPEVIERRKRYFWPYAAVVTVILVGGLIWFITVEQTAIDTVLPIQPGLMTEVSEDVGEPSRGAELWQSLPCKDCHGENAQGGEGPLNVALAGMERAFSDFTAIVRRGPADMPAFGPEVVSDEALAHLYIWLRSLTAPS